MVRWKKHFLIDLFSLKHKPTLKHTMMNTQLHTHTHTVFKLISKAEEAASIFISCWSLSQREGEWDEISVCVCLHVPLCIVVGLQSFHLSVVICISFFQNPLRGFHANHSLSVWASVCQSLSAILFTSGKHKSAESWCHEELFNALALLMLSSEYLKSQVKVANKTKLKIPSFHSLQLWQNSFCKTETRQVTTYTSAIWWTHSIQSHYIASW